MNKLVKLATHPKSGLPDSGARSVSVTGGLRETDDPDRGFFELIPPECEKRIAVHYGRGAVKYAPRNWEKGIDTGRTMRSLMRHVNAYRSGDRREDHLAAIAWNAFCLMYHETRIQAGTLPRELDTYPIVIEQGSSTNASKSESGRIVRPAVRRASRVGRASNRPKASRRSR